NQNTSSTTLISSANPSVLGKAVTFTATVTSSGGTPAGTVTFKDGATTLGTATLNGSGQATFTTSALATGSHAITAAYAGDTNLSGSTSAPLTQAIEAVPADSLKLRALQLAITKIEARGAGRATVGAIEAAVAEGFAGNVNAAPLKPTSGGMR